MTALPQFRFHANPFSSSLDWVDLEDGTKCVVCGRQGPLSLLWGAPGQVCIWCVANGLAYAFAKASGCNYLFNQFDADAVVDAEARLEVERRTPGIPSLQRNDWPVRRGFPMICEGEKHSFDELRADPLRWRAVWTTAQAWGEPDLEGALRKSIGSASLSVVMFRASAGGIFGLRRLGLAGEAM